MNVKKMFNTIGFILFIIFWLSCIAYMISPKIRDMVGKYSSTFYSFSGKVIKIYSSKKHRNQLVVDIVEKEKIETIAIYDLSEDCQRYIQLGDTIKKYKDNRGIWIYRNGDSIFFKVRYRVSSIDRYEIVEDSAIYYRKRDKLYSQ